MRYAIVACLLLLPTLLTQCIDNEITVLRLDRAICSSLHNDFIQRGGTQSDPIRVPFSDAVVEISFLTEVIAANNTNGNALYAFSNSRVLQGIDSVSITSSVSVAPGIDPNQELIDDVFTLVHYPNLQLRDFQRTLNQFNEKISEPRQTSHTHYLYFRMREKYTSAPFDLRFTFFLEGREPINCDCGWIVYF